MMCVRAMTPIVMLVLVATLLVPGIAQAQDKNAVIQQVKTTVEKEKLVTNPACTDYLFTPDGQPGLDLVDVVEKHGGACPGDPQVQHRLFSVYVDQQTKQMISDKDDPVDGTLALLPPADE